MMLMSIVCFPFYVSSFLYIDFSNSESPPLPFRRHWTLRNTRHRSGVSYGVYLGVLDLGGYDWCIGVGTHIMDGPFVFIFDCRDVFFI